MARQKFYVMYPQILFTPQLKDREFSRKSRCPLCRGPEAFSIAARLELLNVFRRSDQLELNGTATNANDIIPAFDLQFDLTIYVEWDRDQVLGNSVVYPERAARKVVSVPLYASRLSFESAPPIRAFPIRSTASWLHPVPASTAGRPSEEFIYTLLK
jgi:hypothetical protein